MLSYINERNVERMIDAKNAEITRKINGDYTLSFIAIDEPDLLEELIVICEGQKYRIKQLSSTMSGNKTLQSVTCKHISFDLIDYYAYDYLTNTVTLDKALQFLFKDTPFTYSISDSIKNQSFEKLGECNKQKLLAKIIEAYGLEYEVDNYHFTFKKKVGYETEFQFRYKANISNVKKDIDTTSLTTYIKGYGKKDDEGNYLCTAEYTSPNAEKFGVRHADPVFDERFTIKSELLEYIKTKINDTPDIVVELDYTQIDSTQPINLGDYGYLIHEPLQLDLLSRVIEITKKLSTDRQGNNYQNMTYKIGSQKLVKSSFETSKDSITGNLETPKVEIPDVIIPDIDYDRIQAEIEAGKQEATDKINSGLGGYVTKTRNELLIMDTEDKATARNLWRWNINGLGFSSNGYSGPYATAITNDGKINADRILVGTIDGALIRANTIKANSLEISTVQKINSAITADDATAIMNTRLEVYDGNIKTHISTVAESKKTEAINSANQNTTSAINSAKTELNQNINTAKSDLTSKINLKANASDVYGKSEVYTKTQTDSAIKQSKDNISLEVSNKYETKVDAEAKITNLKITGVNRVLNTGGESEVLNLNNSSNQTWGPYKISGDVSEQKVIIAFDYKATNIVKGTNPAIRFQSTFKDPSDVSQWYPTFDFNLAEGTSEGTIVSSPITFGKIKKGTQASFRFRFDNVAGTFQISKARVFIGSKDLGWSPAPEDVNSLIDTAAINAINSANQNTATVIANYYTKSETDSKISVAKDEINLGVSNTYETKANVETKVSSTLNSAKSYADTKKTEAINSAATDATSKVNAAKSELNTAIGKKANTVDVYSKAEVYTKGQTDSAIKVAKDEINLGVSNTYETKANVETKVNSIEIGGRNLAKQTKLLTNVSLNGWTVTNTGNEGFKKLEIVTTNTSWQECNIPLYTEINTITRKVTISFEYQETSSGLLMFSFGSYNGNTRVSEITNITVSSSFKVISTNGSWKTVCYTFDPTSVNNKSETTQYKIQFKKSYGMTGTIYIRKPKIEFGTKPTSWSPAPEDISADINTAKNDAITSANSTLNTTIANYYTKSQTDSQINIAKEAINLGVSQTYETKTSTTTKINDAINGIKIGGANLITKKSDFVYGYISSSNGSLNNTGSLNSNQDFYSSNYIFVKSGTPITFTSYPKQGVTSSIQSGVYIHFYNTDKVWQWCKSNTTSANNIATTTYTTEGDCYVRFCSRGFNDYNHMAEFSTKPSEWSPSPKDIDTDINKKANSADVYKKTEVYTKNETNSQITTAKNEINQSVSSTYETKTNVQNKINSIDIGGKNLVKQSRLLTKVTLGGWSVTETGNGEFKKLFIETTNTGWQECSIPLYTEINAITKSVTISFEYQETNSGLLAFSLGSYNGDTRVSEVSNIIVSSSFNVISTNGGWKTVCYTFDPTSVNNKNGITQYKIQFKKASGKTGTIHVRKPKLELGNKATDWSPAPEDVETTVSAVEKRVTSAESKITDTAITNTVKKNFYTKEETNNQITSKGYQTSSQVQQTVDALQLKFTQSGGYNRIRNGIFKNGTSQWSSWGSPTISTKSDTGHSYGKSLVLTTTGTNQGVQQTVSDLCSGKTYTLSAYVYTWAANDCGIQIECGGSYYSSKVPKSGEWQRISVTFKATSTSAIVQIGRGGWGANGQHLFTAIQFEEGELATTYTPHPSEVYDGITTIDKDGIKVSTSRGAYTHFGADGMNSYDNDGNMTLGLRNGGMTFHAWNNHEYVGYISQTASRSTDNNGVCLGMTPLGDYISFGVSSNATDPNSGFSQTSYFVIAPHDNYDNNTLGLNAYKHLNMHGWDITNGGTFTAGVFYSKNGMKFKGNSPIYFNGDATYPSAIWEDTGDGMVRLYGDNGIIMGYRNGNTNEQCFYIKETKDGLNCRIGMYDHLNMNGWRIKNATVNNCSFRLDEYKRTSADYVSIFKASTSSKSEMNIELANDYVTWFNIQANNYADGGRYIACFNYQNGTAASNVGVHFYRAMNCHGYNITNVGNMSVYSVRSEELEVNDIRVSTPFSVMSRSGEQTSLSVTKSIDDLTEANGTVTISNKQAKVELPQGLIFTDYYVQVTGNKIANLAITERTDEYFIIETDSEEEIEVFYTIKAFQPKYVTRTAVYGELHGEEGIATITYEEAMAEERARTAQLLSAEEGSKPADLSKPAEPVEIVRDSFHT